MFCSEILIRAYYWLGYRRPNFMSNRCSYDAFFAVNIRAMFLASVKNKVTVGCLLQHQLTEPLLRMKINSNIDF